MGPETHEVCAGVSLSLNYAIVFLIVIQFYSFTRNIKYGIVSAKRIDDGYSQLSQNHYYVIIPSPNWDE